MRPIPDYGDVMTKEEFLAACKKGAFIDYDGYGCPANPPEMDEQTITPSHTLKHGFPAGFSHIVWFNR